jgi:formiminotetrahydrofolate cyclodeaminase
MSRLPADASIAETIERTGSGAPGHGAGVVAALMGAMAAALVERAARGSRATWREAGGAVAQARALGNRLAELAAVDADAFADAMDALHGRSELPAEARDHSLGAALVRAGEPPAQIAAAAADVAELAALAARDADPEQRAEAAGAATLAHAAARAAAMLVTINLTMRPDDRRRQEVEADVARAAAAEQALAGAGVT